MATTKTAYSMELPDGRIVTRNSDRVYTHAYALLDRRGEKVTGRPASEEKWFCGGFAGSRELAEKGSRKYAGFEGRVVEVKVN